MCIWFLASAISRLWCLMCNGWAFTCWVVFNIVLIVDLEFCCQGHWCLWPNNECWGNYFVHSPAICPQVLLQRSSRVEWHSALKQVRRYLWLMHVDKVRPHANFHCQPSFSWSKNCIKYIGTFIHDYVGICDRLGKHCYCQQIGSCIWLFDWHIYVWPLPTHSTDQGSRSDTFRLDIFGNGDKNGKHCYCHKMWSNIGFHLTLTYSKVMHISTENDSKMVTDGQTLPLPSNMKSHVFMVFQLAYLHLPFAHTKGSDVVLETRSWFRDTSRTDFKSWYWNWVLVLRQLSWPWLLRQKCWSLSWGMSWY